MGSEMCIRDSLQERQQLVDQLAILLGPDLADAGAGALLDVEQQARLAQLLVPTELVVAARSDREGPQQQVERLPDGIGVTVGPEALDSDYQAGRRGKAWRKVKPVHTLDLVVLAAEWGHGRRRGWLSNLHLGARDPERGGFVMLGKTFKGLTDKLLAWQTEKLQQIELGRDRHTVHVKPELVVEIAFNDLQASPRYPGGLALRFARVKRYRDDKTADEADTIETVRRIYAEATGPQKPR